MISIEDLKRIAKLKGITNIGYAEKDYLIDVALLSISRNTKDELVFKGGTCLYKFYGIDRFSEDVDFTLKKQFDVDGLIKKIITDMAAFGISASVKNKKKFLNTVTTMIRAEGPLYRGTAQSFASFRIDINLKSSIDTKPLILKYNSLYPEIPTFSLLVMQESEILAEKIRAIMSRTKARDIYDLWFLLERGVKFNKKMVKEKLGFYRQEWTFTKFSKNLKMKERTWETELGPVLLRVPDFRKVKKSILEKISD